MKRIQEKFHHKSCIQARRDVKFVLTKYELMIVGSELVEDAQNFACIVQYKHCKIFTLRNFCRKRLSEYASLELSTVLKTLKQK